MRGVDRGARSQGQSCGSRVPDPRAECRQCDPRIGQLCGRCELSTDRQRVHAEPAGAGGRRSGTGTGTGGAHRACDDRPGRGARAAGGAGDASSASHFEPGAVPRPARLARQAMSDARAIAAVTATMRHLLTKPVQDLLGNLSDLLVSSQPLDLARKGETRPAQINIFLYQHMVNAAWRNNDMPRQALPGETAFPPLALNLHYLVTAYGRGDNDNDDSAASQLLIGGAM
ncbi:DUF4255 domain-containing protein, partial [Oxalobacteraceae bacterium OM1]